MPLQFLNSDLDMSTALSPQYDAELVFLSVLIAIFASYTAFYVSSRISQTHNAANRYWLSAGAFVLGGGVWAMHFVGMLAYKMPITINYDALLTAVSILPVVFASFFVLKSPANNKINLNYYLIRSALMGSGIGLMHYIGMIAMQLNGDMVYNPWLFALSIIVALVLSAIAVFFKTWAKNHIAKNALYSPAVVMSAIVMGCAISGMHYTGMAAVTVLPNESKDIMAMTLSADALAKIIAIGVTFIGVLLIVLIEFNKRVLLYQQIKNSEEKQKIILETIADAVISINRTGEILSINPAGERLFGYKSNEVVSENIDKLLVIEDSIHYLSNHSGASEEVSGRHKNGFPLTLAGAFSSVSTGEDTAYVGSVQDISKRKIHERKVLYQAHYDSLTNLPNRFLSLERLSKFIAQSTGSDQLVAVLFLDLDGFKRINDTMGHNVGDNLLVQVGKRLSQIVPGNCTVGRLGGDEFIILINNFSSREALHPILKDIQNCLREKFTISERAIVLTTSIGVAIYPIDGDNSSTILRLADSAMYHSKEQGKNKFSFYSEEMSRDAFRKIEIEEQLHEALTRQEFEVFYQPKFQMSDGQIIGAEALIRWDNPKLGKIYPTEFIPIAEASSKILSIGEFVLNESVRFIAECERYSNDSFRIAVNISPCQFTDSSLIDKLNDTLQTNRVDPRSLELEITEGVLMSDSHDVHNTLNAISQLGVDIALDDFGTGYSSLSYLRSYPFDVLKVDRSFVNKITNSESDKELVLAIIAMAQGLKLKVVAEGIETNEQYRILKNMRCDFVQGYLLGKPMPKQQFFDLLHNQNRPMAVPL